MTGVDDEVGNPTDRRTMTISHSASGGGYDVVAMNSVTVPVSDDGGDEGIVLSTTSIWVYEKIDKAAFRVTLDAQSSGMVTVLV